MSFRCTSMSKLSIDAKKRVNYCLFTVKSRKIEKSLVHSIFEVETI